MDFVLGSLLLLVLGVSIGLLWFGLIGGIAGAITGGGREDRSLLRNAGIGLAGSLIGGTIWFWVTEEQVSLTLGGFVSSLLGAILLLLVVGWAQKRRSAAAS